MKKVYVVLAGWDYEGYTDIGMKVFANILSLYFKFDVKHC